MAELCRVVAVVGLFLSLASTVVFVTGFAFLGSPSVWITGFACFFVSVVIFATGMFFAGKDIIRKRNQINGEDYKTGYGKFREEEGSFAQEIPVDLHVGPHPDSPSKLQRVDKIILQPSAGWQGNSPQPQLLFAAQASVHI